MQSEKNLSPLFRLALKSGALDAIALHIHRGESPNGRDAAGLTPLMIAAINNQQACCTRLISLGADVTLLSAGGRTAVELAVEHGHLTLASVLSPPNSSNGDSLDAVSIHDTLQPAPGLSHLVAPNGAALSEAENGTQDAVSFLSEDGEVLASATSDQPECIEELNGWAADETVSVPIHDPNCVAAAAEVQKRISEHRRVSDEIDWSAIEFDLPEACAREMSIRPEELTAIESLIASGLCDGYVTAGDLRRALDTDCARELVRAPDVMERILDDLGVLVECDGVALPLGIPHARDDELAEALDVLRDDLAQPPEPVDSYLTEARRYDLIKREDEERLGRQMDSALGELTRILASLSESDWLLVAPRAIVCSVVAELEEVDDGTENAEPIELAEVQESADGAQGNFRSYVHSVRNGAPENGRDAAVPRPTSVELTSMLDIAVRLDAGAAMTSSIAAYETARDRLVTANLRLAISLAHKYRYSGLPLEDLIQEANIGLMRAAERFDFRRGFKFSTYATWWIRQGMSRSVQDTSRTIRVPVHQGDKIYQVDRARRELEYGRSGKVRPEEIAHHLSLSLREVLQAIRSDIRVVSFEDCGPGLEQYTPDPASIIDTTSDSSQTSCDFSLTAAIERMLVELDKRARQVIIARFGFDGADGKTLEEVGQQFDLTRERIRQIEAKALSRLRHTSRIEILAPYAPIFCRMTE